MTPRTSLTFVLALVVTAAPLAAQTVATKDPQAVAVAQQSISAMGGTTFPIQDCVVSGTLQYVTPKGTVTLPIVIKSKGTTQVRTEVQWPQGTRVRILNGGQGAILKSDGTVVWLLTNNTIAERASHIPVLSLLADAGSTSMEVLNSGTGAVSGRPTNIISISYVPTSDSKWAKFYRSTTLTLFHIDTTSGTIAKTEYLSFAENDTNLSQKVETYFSDYRNTSGVLVPYQQTTYTDGTLSSTLTFSSVAFNVGISDSEFTLPQRR